MSKSAATRSMDLNAALKEKAYVTIQHILEFDAKIHPDNQLTSFHLEDALIRAAGNNDEYHYNAIIKHAITTGKAIHMEDIIEAAKAADQAGHMELAALIHLQLSPEDARSATINPETLVKSTAYRNLMKISANPGRREFILPGAGEIKLTPVRSKRAGSAESINTTSTDSSLSSISPNLSSTSSRSESPVADNDILKQAFNKHPIQPNIKTLGIEVLRKMRTEKWTEKEASKLPAPGTRFI